MPKNSFKVSVSTAAVVLAEPIEGVITDVKVKNTAASTVYVDFNNPAVDATDGYPIAAGVTETFTLVPSSVIYAIAAGAITVNTYRSRSPFSLKG